jgi:hypothetical protein
MRLDVASLFTFELRTRLCWLSAIAYQFLHSLSFIRNMMWPAVSKGDPLNLNPSLVWMNCVTVTANISLLLLVVQIF